MATVVPDEVNVLLLVVESRVRVVYVRPGILLVSVNVNEPTEPAGTVIVPVDTVTVPELENVPDTLKPFEPTAYVPAASVRLV